MQQEIIWKEVVGYYGKYLISESGDVQSVFSESKLGKRRPTGTILKTGINRNGYRILHLQRRVNGVIEKKTRKIHRLVCEAFHPNPENKPQINHKDLDRLNNHASNLEWCTAKENVYHAQINGRMPMGKKQYAKKGRPIGIKKIVDIVTGETYEHVQELAAKTGMKLRNLRRMISGERYNHTNFRYVGQEDLVKERVVKDMPLSPICVFNFNGEIIRDFDYVQDAANYVKCKVSDINLFLKGQRSHVKTYKFKMIAEDGSCIEPIPFISKKPPLKPKRIPQPTTPSKVIIKTDLDGNELQRFSSFGDACRHSGANKSNLRKVMTGKCKGRPGYYKGYFYRYAN